MITAEVTGLLIYFFIPYALKIFGSTQEAVAYGTIHAHIVSLFFFLLAFSHCSAGVMRGCGYAVVPMAGMLLSGAACVSSTSPQHSGSSRSFR